MLPSDLDCLWLHIFYIDNVIENVDTNCGICADIDMDKMIQIKEFVLTIKRKIVNSRVY